MTSEERWDMLSKEQIKMNPTGEKVKITKEDEIRGLESLIKCMKHFEELSEDELKKVHEDGMKKIIKKYEK